MRSRYSLSAALALLLFVTACGTATEGGESTNTTQSVATTSTGGTGTTAATQEPDSGGAGGELVFALKEEPDALDPSLSVSLVSDIIYRQMCDKLYEFDESLTPQPILASSLPEVSEDGLEVTIPLRTGILFQDGTEFNADAVKATFERHLAIEGSARAAELSLVQAVDVVDSQTVKFTLASPFSPLVALLADRAGIIMSPSQIEALGVDFGREPVCVGPYEFIERVAQSRVVLERDTDYFDQTGLNLDRIIFEIIPDGNVRVANVRSGDVDVAEQVPPTDVATLESDPNVDVLSVDSLGFQSLRINIGNVASRDQPFGVVDTPLGSDPMVRKALEMAIDRDRINEIVYQGLVTPDCFPLPLDSQYYPTDLTCTSFDPDGARQLLEESGHSLPVAFSIMTLGNDPAELRTIELIQAMANEVGFDVTIDVQEFGTSISKANAGDFDTWLAIYGGRPDPDGNIQPFFATDGHANRQGINDPTIDGLISDARTASDPAERKQIYTEILERVVVDAPGPMIFLYHPRLFLGVASGVDGVLYHPDGVPVLRFASRTDS